MLVNNIADKLIYYYINNKDKYGAYVEGKINYQLTPKGVYKVLKTYERVFHQHVNQSKGLEEIIFTYKRRLIELQSLRGMNFEIVEIIDKRIQQTKYKLNKFQQKWRKEHEL